MFSCWRDLWQRAKSRGDTEKYRTLRNRINRKTRYLRSGYYKRKVEQLYSSESRQWWKSVGRIIGSNRSDPTDTFSGMANEYTDGDFERLANSMNSFFQSVSADLPPIPKDHPNYRIQAEIEDKYIISVSEVERQLTRIKEGKSAGPDGIQAWMLRDLAPILAPPITAIFNSSIRDGYVPEKWKRAIVTPLPKKSPPSLLEKDIRPISLTCLVAKELERIVIKHLRQYTSIKSDPLLVGNKKGVSTTDMLVKLLHHWHEATDKGHSVRVVFLDYSKAFDQVNHNILLEKLAASDPPPFLLKWITSFLSERSQCVRLGEFLSGILFSVWRASLPLLTT